MFVTTKFRSIKLQVKCISSYCFKYYLIYIFYLCDDTSCFSNRFEAEYHTHVGDFSSRVLCWRFRMNGMMCFQFGKGFRRKTLHAFSLWGRFSWGICLKTFWWGRWMNFESLKGVFDGCWRGLERYGKVFTVSVFESFFVMRLKDFCPL